MKYKRLKPLVLTIMFLGLGACNSKSPDKVLVSIPQNLLPGPKVTINCPIDSQLQLRSDNGYVSYDWDYCEKECRSERVKVDSLFSLSVMYHSSSGLFETLGGLLGCSVDLKKVSISIDIDEDSSAEVLRIVQRSCVEAYGGIFELRELRNSVFVQSPLPRVLLTWELSGGAKAYLLFTSDAQRMNWITNNPAESSVLLNSMRLTVESDPDDKRTSEELHFFKLDFGRTETEAILDSLSSLTSSLIQGR